MATHAMQAGRISAGKRLLVQLVGLPAGWLVHVCHKHAAPPPSLPPPAQEARTNEVAPGNDDFQAAIKRGVPLGWVFKGFPFHTTQPAPGAIWRALADEPQVRACVLPLQESTACS